MKYSLSFSYLAWWREDLRCTSTYPRCNETAVIYQTFDLSLDNKHQSNIQEDLGYVESSSPLWLYVHYACILTTYNGKGVRKRGIRAKMHIQIDISILHGNENFLGSLNLRDVKISMKKDCLNVEIISKL